jgi:phosphatidylserine decarboxylase
MMRIGRELVGRLTQQPHLNFVLTNWIPRRQLTLLMARFSRIENPLVRVPSLALWRFFADVDLSDSRQQRFRSLHDCFVRELREGARPIDPRPGVLASPCDAEVGQLGTVDAGTLLQAKGRSYALADLLEDSKLAARHAHGRYLTLRLTAGMYHRFHAPEACTIERVDYIGGDTWNVNPQTLRWVDHLYCRNERAVLSCRLADDGWLTLVPVAAILVASIRLHCLGERLHLKYRGPGTHHCQSRYERGAELGWFEHGSTIIMLAPPQYRFLPHLAPGVRVRMGEALLQKSADAG